eukprot:scaffold53865_cov17-Prasinocladus_malaysianus.AAC.1
MTTTRFGSTFYIDTQIDVRWHANQPDAKNKAFELGVVELAAMPLQQLEAGDVSTIGTVDIQARLSSFARYQE